MPTDEKILGFSNPWYESAIKTAVIVNLPTGQAIKLVSPAYFLATKLSAFYGRGRSDFLMSHDIEDTVEEKTIRLQEKKQALADSVYGGKQQEGVAFGQNDLMELLKPLE